MKFWEETHYAKWNAKVKGAWSYVTKKLRMQWRENNLHTMFTCNFQPRKIIATKFSQKSSKEKIPRVMGTVHNSNENSTHGRQPIIYQLMRHTAKTEKVFTKTKCNMEWAMERALSIFGMTQIIHLWYDLLDW